MSTVSTSLTTNNTKKTVSNPGNNNIKVANGNSSRLDKRSELELLIRELQTKLGPNWDKYHENLSLFLIGKLSRKELVNNIVPILKDGLIKYHNRLLLLNFANSFKDIPIDVQNEFATFWNKKAKNKTVKSSQYEKFKQNIMGLPIKERRRIRNITRESGKKNKINAGITLTRHSLLPKIPSIQDKEQQQLQVNNLVAWQQDVVNGINTPIATDNYELPDDDDLSKRVLMIMRESGLTGGINSQVLEVIVLGLESYLRNIVESTIDVARYRGNKYNNSDFLSTAIQTVKETFNDKMDISNDRATNDINSSQMDQDSDDDDESQSKRRKVTLNINDMYDSLEMFPYLIDPSGPKYRLNNVMLKNDDEVDDLDYQLPPKPITEINGKDKTIENTNDNETNNNKNNQTVKPVNHVGTSDELKWVLHDLFSEM